ncbi:pheromone-binding protein-related protein 6 [Leptinotarsa decemlineata]|uniref:pheromone-binding protein-related protein 6 n=1 Tax=Leptinotarsa decemlineata TaxID=7539 RepID=UPI003D30CD1F
MNTTTKVMLAFFIYTVVAYMDPKDFGDKLTKLGNECHDICTDVTGATEEMIIQVRNGNFIDDEKMKRYVLCLCRVSRLMDKDLKIDMVALNEVLPAGSRKNVPSGARDCLVNARNSDLKEKYDKVYEMEKCLYNLNPDEFIMF